jgi:thioredoxin 1
MTNTEKSRILNNTNFMESVKEGVTLVDFWAEWCIPCRMQAPIIDKVHTTIGSRALIGKIDVDENAETAVRLGIVSIPTLVLFKDGKEIKRFVGVQSESLLVETLEKALA